MKSRTFLRQFWLRSFVSLTLMIATALAVMAQTEEAPETIGETTMINSGTLVATTQSDSLIAIISPTTQSSFNSLPVKLVVRLSKGINPTSFRARLNGQDITGKFTRGGACGISACDLSATMFPSDGLAKGQNTLNVEIRSFGLVQSSDASVFTVAVNPPIANAGVDRRVKRGRLVQLDGTGSLSGNSNNSLTHTWELTQRPDGSQAKLNDPNSSKPSFTPDEIGIYTAKLIVSEDQGFTSEPNTVSFIVTANDPTLVSVQTNISDPDGSGHGILVGNINYDAFDPANSTGLHILVLDRATLEYVTHRRYYFSPSGANTANDVVSFLNSLDSGKIVIISTLARVGIDLAGLAPSLESFGATAEFRNIHSGDAIFTLIGVKGMPLGQAYQIIGPNPNLIGYFAKDSHKNYAFAQFDYISYNVLPDPTGKTNGTITINGKDYTAATFSCHGQGGFHLVAVDRTSPAKPLLLERIYCLPNYNSATNNDAPESVAMADQLSKFAADESTLVFITSFGNAGQNAALNYSTRQVALQIAALGGSYDLFAFGGQPPGFTYSLIGAGSPPNGSSLPAYVGAESSNALPDAPSGQIRGVLGRGRRENFYSSIASDPSGIANLELYNLIAQPAQTFPIPAPGNTGQLNAFNFINRELCGSCATVRGAYPDTDIDLDTLSLRLALLDYPSPPPNPAFSQDDLETVRAQLLEELTYAADIRSFNMNLTQLWNSRQSNINLILSSVGAKVQNSLNPPPASKVPSIVENVIGTALSIGSYVAGEFNPVFGVMSGVFTVGTTLANTLEGSNTIVNVGTTVAELGGQAADSFAELLASQGTIFNLIYEDWGRLKALGSALGNPENSNWKWNGDLTTGQLLNGLDLAVERSYYHSLLPTTYKTHIIPDTYWLQPGDACGDLQPPCKFTNNWTAWVLSPENIQQNNFFNIYCMYFGNYQSPGNPPQDIVGRLFTPVSQGGLGISPRVLIQRWLPITKF